MVNESKEKEEIRKQDKVKSKKRRNKSEHKENEALMMLCLEDYDIYSLSDIQLN